MNIHIMAYQQGLQMTSFTDSQIREVKKLVEVEALDVILLTYAV